MKRETFGFYFIRLILIAAIFAFMAMLYWSSALIEQRLQTMNTELSQIKREISNLRSDNERIRRSTPSPTSASVAQNTIPTASNDNILKPDPFYETTLPHMLGPDFTPHGQRKEGTYGKPDNLHPFAAWAEVSSWNTLCGIAVASNQVGIYETYVPDGALSMELQKNDKGQEEYLIKLRQDAFWEPLSPSHFGDSVVLAPHFLERHPVTAHDYKFFYDAFMNKGVEEGQAITYRLFYADIEEFKIIDDYTFIVRWKTEKIVDDKGEVQYKPKYLSKSLTAALKPLACFVYQYFSNGKKIIPEDTDPETYRTNTIWAQNFSHHWANNIIVSCGAWLFDGMTDREVRFKRNPNYYDPLTCLVDSYTITFKSSTDGVWEDFKIGALDSYTVPPNQLAELYNFLQAPKNFGVKSLVYLMQGYNYIGWNQAKPLFTSKKVRQALTMAIDRNRIIKQILNGMGMEITGPFSPNSPSYDKSIKPYPYDPDQALQLLHEEGWFDSTGSGVLDKEINGQRVPFQFTLTYFVKNQTTKAICEYVVGALKEIGIQCLLNGVDMADLSHTFEDKSFEALYLGWSGGSPPEDPKQIWYSSGAKQKGSSNAIGFINKEADEIIDKLSYEYDAKKRDELYHRFDAIIHDEAPYIFLYAPKVTYAYRDYLQNVFIPAQRQDLIPGANMGEPISSIFWIKDK